MDRAQSPSGILTFLPEFLTAMQRPDKLDSRQLRKQLRAELSECWMCARLKHPEETPYAFVLYGVDDTPSLIAVILTEESLTVVAQRYVSEGYYETLDEAREDLRWSVADSPNYDDLLDAMPNVDALVEPWASTVDEKEGYKRLADVAVKALKDLDDVGAFGDGAARDSLVLSVMTPDAEVDHSLPTAVKLNSPATYERFASQLSKPGIHRSCDKLVCPGGGGEVYFMGSRATDPPDLENEFIREIVAADLAGLKVVRRWAYELTKEGDIVRDIAWDETSSTLLGLRITYLDSETTSLLLRFAGNSAEPMYSRTLDGEPLKLIVAPEGSQLGVLYSKRFMLLDDGFQELASLTFETRSHDAKLLRDGHLLLATYRGVIRVNLTTREQSAPTTDGPADRLQVSGDHRVLSVSRTFDDSPYSDRRPRGIHVYELPSLRPIRTIELPDRRCVLHCMSDDGRVIAFEACDTKSRAIEIVAVDAESGAEVARQRTKHSVIELAFLPDSYTLAICGSEYRESEPIDFWKIPMT